MSTGTLTPTDRPDSDMGLAGEQLPRWMLPVVAVAAAVVTLGLFAATELQGRAGFVVVLVLVYLVGQSLASFRVEGRRRAVDRLATTAVYSAFVIAIIPLVSVLATVISKGAKVLNADLPHPLPAGHRPQRHGRRHLSRHRRQPRDRARDQPDLDPDRACWSPSISSSTAEASSPSW